MIRRYPIINFCGWWPRPHRAAGQFLSRDRSVFVSSQTLQSRSLVVQRDGRRSGARGTQYLGHIAWLPMCSFRFLLKHRIVSMWRKRHVQSDIRLNRRHRLVKHWVAWFSVESKCRCSFCTTAPATFAFGHPCTGTWTHAVRDWSYSVD